MATRTAHLCYFLGFLLLVVGQLSARVIHDSPGGSGAYALELAADPHLVIDGSCRSACAWGFMWNPKACITARGSITFHAAHDPGTGQPMRLVTDSWVKTLPANIQARVKSAMDKDHTLTFTGRELGRLCP